MKEQQSFTLTQKHQLPFEYQKTLTRKVTEFNDKAQEIEDKINEINDLVDDLSKLCEEHNEEAEGILEYTGEIISEIETEIEQNPTNTRCALWLEVLQNYKIPKEIEFDGDYSEIENISVEFIDENEIKEAYFEAPDEEKVEVILSPEILKLRQINLQRRFSGLSPIAQL